MATYNEIIEGLKLQAQYIENGLEAHISGAEHDIIYGMTDDISMSDGDRARLKALGWHVGEATGVWCHFV